MRISFSKYIILGLVIGIFVFSGCAFSKQEPLNTTAVNTSTKTISITAKQWSFEPSVIEVQKGESVRLLVKSVDVNHGFELPDFNINEVLSPGNEITVEFVADKAGRFDFSCSLFCGSGHSQMKGTLVVHE